MTITTFPEHLLTPPPPNLKQPPTPEQTEQLQTCLKALEDHFGKDGFELPITEGSEELRGLSEREMMLLSRETFIRFLIGTKYDLQHTITRLEKCIVWRRTERIDDIDYMSEECSPESETGKNIVLGFSPSGQPVVYFFPNRNTTPVEKRRAVHAVFMVERATDLMISPITSLLVIFNFSGKRQGPPTSISVARETLHILSEYYPEKLGTSIFQDMPWVVKAFVNLMWPFVDANTKKKVKFGSSTPGEVDREGWVGREMLLKECGGDLDLPYDHDTYWPALIATCKQRRKEHLKNFKALGEPKVGREEKLFKKPPAPSLVEKKDDTGSSTPIEIETEAIDG